MMLHRWGLVLIIVSFVVAGLSSAEAARPTRSTRRRAQFQRNSAILAQRQTQLALERSRAALSAALSRQIARQGDLASAAGRTQSQVDAFNEARTALKSAHASLHDLEADLEAEQPADSPVAKAKQQLANATQDLRQVEESILLTDEAKRRLASLDATSTAEDHLRVRSELLEASAAYTTKRERAARARADYDRARLALYTGDAEWKAVSTSLREALSALAQAEGHMEGSALSKAAASGKARSAAADVRELQAIVQQNEARAKALARITGKKVASPGSQNQNKQGAKKKK